MQIRPATIQLNATLLLDDFGCCTLGLPAESQTGYIECGFSLFMLGQHLFGIANYAFV